MGQQQLILIILVSVLVGIATVVAINTYTEAAKSANLDAIRIDLGTIGAQAQAFYNKPIELGGGGKAFTNISFNDITIARDSLNGNNMMLMNQNALYSIESVAENEIVITAQPKSGEAMDFSNVHSTDLTLLAEISVGNIDIRFQN